MDGKERLAEIEREKERLNRAWRNLFKAKGTTLESARKRVLKDLDDIEKAASWLPNKEGTYCNTRGWINEGGRKLAKDIVKKIESKPNTGEKNKPTVNT